MRTRQQRVQKMVFSALLAALTCVCTMIIQIPIPATGGYINLGDSMVLLCAWYIGGLYGVAAAGIGSMMADIFSGYVIYAPATFLTKACMALAAWLLFKKLHNHHGQYLGAIAAALVLAFGYLLFESCILGYGFGALAGLPANLIQGFTGAVSGVFLSRLMERNAFLKQQLHREQS